MNALGLDGGFANLGFGVADYRAREVLHAGVIRTKKSDKKQHVFSSDDLYRRTEEIAGELIHIVSTYEVRIVTMESFSYPRSSMTAAQLGMSFGVVATITRMLGLPVAFLSPKQLKLNTAGSASASKQEVARAVIDHFGTDWAPDGVPEGKLEHMCDALASIIGAQNSPIMRALR